MKKAILKTVGGKEGDWQKIYLMLIAGFFSGIFFATYDIGALTLFLEAFDEEKDLPKAFICSGVIGVLSTYIFAFFQKRIKFNYLSNISLVIITGGLIFLSFCINYYKANLTIVFIAYILFTPAKAFINLVFWGTFIRIFEIKEAKSLAGGIEAGQFMAIFFSFLAIPFIQVFLTDNRQFLYLSSISVALFLVTFLILFKKCGLHSDEDLLQEGPEANNSKSEKVNMNYLLLMGTFIVLSTLCVAFVNFSFLTVTTTQFRGEVDSKALTNFLAFFNGTITICSFLTQTFVANKVLEIVGFRVYMLILPILLGAICLISTSFGMMFGIEGMSSTFLFFFLIIAIKKLLTEALYESLQTPVFKNFFFPVSRDKRADVQTKIEGVVKEFSWLVAGVAMMALGALEFNNVLYNNYILFLIIIGWIITGLQLHKVYRNELTKTLKRTKTSSEPKGPRQAGRKSLASFIISKLETTRSESLHFLFRMAAKIDPLLLEQVFQKAIHTQKFEVQKEILLESERLHLLELRELISKVAKKHSHEGLKTLGNGVLKKLTDTEVLSWDLPKVSFLATSKSPKDRKFAAKLISRNYNHDTFHLLIPLLRDIDPNVREEALITAGKIKAGQLLPILIDHLALEGYANTAIAAIVNFGKDALTSLEAAYQKSGQTSKGKVHIIQTIGRIGGDEATAQLVKKINEPDPKIANEIFVALNECGWSGSGEEATFVKNALRIEAGKYIWNLAATLEADGESGYDELLDAIHIELSENLQNIFLLLSLVYDKESVKLVQQNIEFGSSESIAYAMELMDIFLEDDLKAYIPAVFEDITKEERVRKLAIFFPREKYGPKELLIQIINRDYNWTNRWTKATAMRLLIQTSNGEICQDIVANLFNPDPLLRETAAWGICLHEPDRYNELCKRLSPAIVKEMNSVVLKAVKGESANSLRIEKVRYLLTLPFFKNIPITQIADIVEFINEIYLSKEEEYTLSEMEGKFSILLLAQGKAQTYHLDQPCHLLVKGGLVSELFPEYSQIQDWKLVANEKTILFEINSDLFFEYAATAHGLSEKLSANFESILETETPQVEEASFEKTPAII